jgi:alpha-L-arabinofuranosidase
VDGALRQTTEKEFIRALAGDRDWTNYTLTLQARKISGAEGFLILFHIRGDEDRRWWNIGGWGNTADAIEADGLLGRKSAHIETGRWYDLKVVVTGNHVQCYRDGTLEHDIDYDTDGDVASLYAVAASDEKTGDLILKVANANYKPLDTEINLEGAGKLTGNGTAMVLTSEAATDENTLGNPTKISPTTTPVKLEGTSLRYSFPGNSFTVLRLKAKL